MGVLIGDLQDFIRNHSNRIWLLSNGEIDIKAKLEHVKKQFELLHTAFSERGGIETRLSHEMGEYLPPLNISVTINALKDLTDIAKENGIKIKSSKKIYNQYAIWFPEKSEAHMNTMEYIRNSDKRSYDLVEELMEMKKNGQLYFDNFDELDYDDLVLLWSTKLIVDSKIQELYSLKSASTVATRRKNLFISDQRMAVLKSIS